MHVDAVPGRSIYLHVIYLCILPSDLDTAGKIVVVGSASKRVIGVVPANAKADALAAAEAVLGQIYLTVLVARLVALNLVGMRPGVAKRENPKQT